MTYAPTFRSEEFEELRRIMFDEGTRLHQTTMEMAGSRMIHAALRIATNVMRPGLIEQEIEEGVLPSTIAAAIRRALTEGLTAEQSRIPEDRERLLRDLEELRRVLTNRSSLSIYGKNAEIIVEEAVALLAYKGGRS